MYVGIEQNIVNLAGSTSDFVNGLDMNSSSIRAQILLQNFQVTEPQKQQSSQYQSQCDRLLMVHKANICS